MAIATISLILIVSVLIFIFIKIEKKRKDKSIVDYYIKPGIIGSLFGVLAVILRGVLSLVLSLLFARGESFKKIIADITNIRVISIVLMIGALLGIFVAVTLQKER